MLFRSLATPLPNPSRGPATFEFTIPSAGSVDLSVLDLAGRRLARLQNGLLPAGPHRVQWSGRDAADRRLEPGVYWVSLEFHGERRSRRLAIVD